MLPFAPKTAQRLPVSSPTLQKAPVAPTKTPAPSQLQLPGQTPAPAPRFASQPPVPGAAPQSPFGKLPTMGPQRTIQPMGASTTPALQPGLAKPPPNFNGVPGKSVAGLPPMNGAPPGTPPGAAPGQPPGSGNMDDLNKLYEDILGQHDASWGDQQKLLQGQMGASQRSADNLNARMGRSIGGGYSQLQGQAMAGGMRAMSEAKLKSDEQRRGVMLDWNEKKLGEKHRQEERGWAQSDADRQAMFDYMNAQIAAGNDVDWGDMAQFMSGGGSPDDFWAEQQAEGAKGDAMVADFKQQDKDRAAKHESDGVAANRAFYGDVSDANLAKAKSDAEENKRKRNKARKNLGGR